MIEATPSPASASWRRPVVRDSNLRCRGAGDTPWNQASGLTVSTLPVYGGGQCRVVEVEPPLLPIRIVGSHGAQWVQLLACVPQHECEAAGTNRLARSPLTRGEGVELAVEEVDPEVPVRQDPQKSLTDGDEGSCLQDGVRGEVVELHPVMVAQPLHEPAHRGGEAALVQADEADDVAVQGVRLSVRRWRDHPCRVRAITGRQQLPSIHPLVTEPPKIILYYRLSLSTWPLSDNKELFCHLCQEKPGKSLTTGSRYVLSPHEGGTRVQVQHYIKVQMFKL
jgi:hypothetical protein